MPSASRCDACLLARAEVAADVKDHAAGAHSAARVHRGAKQDPPKVEEVGRGEARLIR